VVKVWQTQSIRKLNLGSALDSHSKCLRVNTWPDNIMHRSKLRLWQCKEHQIPLFLPWLRTCFCGCSLCYHCCLFHRCSAAETDSFTLLGRSVRPQREVFMMPMFAVPFYVCYVITDHTVGCPTHYFCSLAWWTYKLVYYLQKYCKNNLMNESWSDKDPEVHTSKKKKTQNIAYSWR
jgi:cellulose synthase/poly-beta-1,6-N-acetylglucosamine synthase-like glycosyltransferase